MDQTCSKSTNGSSTIWLGSIPESFSDELIFDHMERVGGEVVGLRLIPQRGFGYVRFGSEQTAARVLNMRVEIQGKKLRVDTCQDIPTLPHPFRPILGSKPHGCTTLFVGNLPADASEDLITAFFNDRLHSVGVKIQSVSLRKGGLKGMSFAHVRFHSSEDCERAVQTVAGEKISEKGHRIRVDWAVEKPGMERSSINAELRGKTNKIFVAGLNEEITETDLTNALNEFGDVTSVRLNRDKHGSRSFGYVTFSAVDSATNAVDKISTISVNGHKIRADFARPDKPPAATQNILPIRENSPVPDYPRITPVSYQVPEGYGPMPSWIECYGDALVGSG
jgi:RNA recognition motif-containing protein